MHLLGSYAHLPLSRDRDSHRPAHLLREHRLQNVTKGRRTDALAHLSGALEHFSTSDAHLSSSKMHRRPWDLPSRVFRSYAYAGLTA